MHLLYIYYCFLELTGHSADDAGLAERLSNFGRRGGGFLLVSRHQRSPVDAGHYHVVHSCSHQYRCRCFTLGFGTVFGRRDFANVTKVTSFTQAHWRNLYLYLEKGPGLRSLIFFQSSYRGDNRIQNIVQHQHVPVGSDEPSPSNGDGCKGDDPQLVGTEFITICDTGSQAKRMDGSSETQPTKRKFKYSQADILEAAKFIASEGWKTWCNDLQKIMRMDRVRNRVLDILFAHKEEVELKALHAIQLMFEPVKGWKFNDIRQNFLDEQRYILKRPFVLDDDENSSFSCLSDLFGQSKGNRLMDARDSADVIIRLMEINCQNVVGKQFTAKEFFLDWVKWFDGARGKKNTQLLIGLTNGAKSWFSEAWAKLALFIGYISNPTRGETAPFSGIKDSRVILWDEADLGLEAHFADICKMILGGQDVSVNIKYKNRTVLESCPVVMCSNRYPCRISDQSVKAPLEERWQRINWESSEEISKVLIYGPCNPIGLFLAYDWAISEGEDALLAERDVLDYNALYADEEISHIINNIDENV